MINTLHFAIDLYRHIYGENSLPRKLNVILTPTILECGLCWPDKKGVMQIRINSTMSDYLILSTMFHELTHAQQFHQGTLRMTKRGFYWKGKRIKNSYSRQHWERQAFRRESKLLKVIYND